MHWHIPLVMALSYLVGGITGSVHNRQDAAALHGGKSSQSPGSWKAGRINPLPVIPPIFDIE